MFAFRVTAFLALASSVVATPVISNVCPVVTNVVSALHAYPSAGAFCSSFIGIKTSTITATSTVTPSGVVVPNSVAVTADALVTTATGTVNTTITSTTPVYETPTATATATETSTNALNCFATATTLGSADNAVKKRNFPPVTSKTSTISSVKTSSKTSSQSPSSTKSSSSSANKASITPVSTTKVSSSTKGSTSCTVPAALSSYASSALSTACSCLSLATPSTTVTTTTTLSPVTVVSTIVATVTPTSTVTSTVTNTVTESASTTSTLDAVTITSTTTVTTNTVNPTGLSYYYYHPVDTTSSYDSIPGVIAEVSNNNGYSHSGTVQNLNTFRNGYDFGTRVYGPMILPDGTSVSAQNFGIVFQGYFYASAGAGTYTIDSTSVDDTALAWIGPTKAYGNNWNYGNADYVAHFLQQYSTRTSFEAAAGEAIPITLFYTNVDGPGSSSFFINTPDGQQYRDTTPFLVGACASSNLFQP
ncbi:hypothetical protein ACLMJK_001317 [Lecanora helva]